ncbi:MAG: BspA family leucine-rich repeat surface protein [Cyclobacteriaceae bacterium]|nr:BspA family leucine-rich repeat surface protein [Cyclobacteriaceae bacterium]
MSFRSLSKFYLSATITCLIICSGQFAQAQTVTATDLGASNVDIYKTIRQRVYGFSILSTGGSSTLTALTTQPTGGTYTASDITDFDLYFNTVDNFASATLVGTSSLSAGTGEAINFNAFSQVIADDGLAKYFYIATNVAPGATTGATFSIPSFTVSNFTFSAVVTFGGLSLGPSGTKTIQGQAPFITTWKTDNPGSSNDNQITIPTTGLGYDYDILWFEVGNPTNTGTVTSATGSVTIDFPVPGIYQVEITGQFPRIFFNAGFIFSSQKDSDKILSVEQWGNIAWTSMSNAFAGCDNLRINAVDAPDLSGVTDLSRMFFHAISMNDDISGWNVGSVLNMSGMFRDAESFNQPLDSWSVDGVTNMSEMFYFASAFNQDLNNWQVDNVTNMDSMFGGALAFNGDVSTWHVDNVTNFSGMFSVAEAFNGDISGWQITNATNLGGMFNGAISFNQDISTKIGGGNNGGDAWDTNGVLNMSGLFRRAIAFNQPIVNWDVSTVTDMDDMFSDHPTFNQNITGWVVNNVQEMRSMFENATSFNQNISSWDVSNVNDFNGMFANATSFNQPIGTWTLNSVSNIDMRNMFAGASSFDRDLSGWDVSKLTLAANMFNNSGLSVANYDLLLEGWAAQSVNSGVNFGAQGVFYCSAGTARAALIAAGWFITDAGSKCISLFDGPGLTDPEILDGQAEAIDFGSTSTTKRRTFTILNNQGSVITNVVVTISGTAFSTPSTPVTIGAGSTHNFNIDLSGSTGTFLETVSITSDNFTGTFQFDLIGVVTASPEPEIKVFEGPTVLGSEITSSSTLDFGIEFRGTDVIQEFTITNLGSADLNVSNISTNGAYSVISATSLVIPVDGTEVVQIQLSGATGGAFSEPLTIESDDADEANFSFDLFGIIVGPDLWVVDGLDIFSDPEILNGQSTPIDIGSGTFGTDVVKQLTITDATSVNLAITNISISGTAFSFTPAAPFGVAGEIDGIYDEVLFEITLSGAASGTFNETVTITSDDDAEPIFSFPITGTIISTGCATLPTVNAGADISLCTGNAVSLSGTIGGSATTATWSTTGSGSFDDNTLLGATYTLSGADVSSGSVILTLTVPAAGPCPQVQDQLVVSIASTPVAGSPSVQGNVGVATNIDVISNSTIGSGDVITVTIQNNPSKGTVTVNTNNTISYIAGTGTIGVDSFEYQICNQCNLCSSGTIAIDIANAAPVFTAPSTTPEAAPGQLIVISIPDVISDLNDNIDLNSFSNFSSTANAAFSYDANTGDLTLDYTNAVFTSEQDNISFTICDLLNSCTDVTMQIDLNGEITVFNGISPNADGMNDFFNIENIQFVEPTNNVSIFNRWGDKVYEQENYDSQNPDKRFEGKQNNGTELPSGIYFYKVEFPSGREELTGYLTVKK